MIQLADDGSVFAGPLKSSLQTRLQPPGVGGTAALACRAVAAEAAITVAAMAATVRQRRSRDRGACAVVVIRWPLCEGRRPEVLHVAKALPRHSYGEAWP